MSTRTASGSITSTGLYTAPATAGSYTAEGRTFGAGARGDLAATVAAVLLDAEARGDTPARRAGKLREPVLMFTGVLRALIKDGAVLAGSYYVSNPAGATLAAWPSEAAIPGR